MTPMVGALFAAAIILLLIIDRDALVVLSVGLSTQLVCWLWQAKDTVNATTAKVISSRVRLAMKPYLWVPLLKTWLRCKLWSNTAEAEQAHHICEQPTGKSESASGDAWNPPFPTVTYGAFSMNGETLQDIGATETTSESSIPTLSGRTSPTTELGTHRDARSFLTRSIAERYYGVSTISNELRELGNTL